MHKIHSLTLIMIMALATTSQLSLTAADSWAAAYAAEMARGPAVVASFATGVAKMIDLRATKAELKTKRLARESARKTARERLAKELAAITAIDHALQHLIPEERLIGFIASYYYCGEQAIKHAHNDVGPNSWLPSEEKDNDMVRLRYRCIERGTLKSGRLALCSDNSWSDVQAMIQRKTRISVDKQLLRDPRGDVLTQLADLLDYFTDQEASRVIWVKNSDSK